MQTPKTPKRAWWRPRTWWFVLLLWLIVLNEISVGPVFYCYERGWISNAAFRFYCQYSPHLLPDAVGEATGMWDYNRWCHNLGRRHAGKPEKPY